MKKKISNIVISGWTDDIREHRYSSIDEWQEPSIYDTHSKFNFQTADTGNMDYNFLILLHALIEQYLCFKHKITDEQVCEWDMKHTHCNDPGNHKEAPYFREHKAAEELEAMMSTYLNVVWSDYGKAIDKTLKKWKGNK